MLTERTVRACADESAEATGAKSAKSQEDSVEVFDQRGFTYVMVDQKYVQQWLRVLNGLATRTYIALISFAWYTQECYPSTQTLADIVGTSRSGIGDALNVLEAYGLIRREERKRQDGGWTSNRYYLLPVPDRPDGVTKATRGEMKSAGMLKRQTLGLPMVVEGTTPEPQVPSHVASGSTVPPKKTTDPRVREVMKMVAEVTGGIVNGAKEAYAAKRLLGIELAPTVEEIEECFREWFQSRPAQFGYSLTNFANAAPAMIKRMRGGATPTGKASAKGKTMAQRAEEQAALWEERFGK